MPLNHSSEPLTGQDARALAGWLVVVLRRLSLPDDELAARLPLAQLRVCGMLRGGERPLSDLARELGVSLPAMTQIADRLQRSGLARRVAGQADRRVKRLRLTERGVQILRRREAARVRRVREVLQPLPSEARRRIVEGMQALAEACRGPSQPVPAAVPRPPRTARRAAAGRDNDHL